MEKYPLNFLIAPIDYLRNNKKQEWITNELLFNLLQEALHNCLYEFLNGGDFMRYTRLLFPIVDDLKNNFNQVLFFIELLKERNGLHKSFAQIGKIAKLRHLTPKKTAEIISLLYSAFYSQVKNTDTKIKKYSVTCGKTFDTWEREIKDRYYLEPVFTIYDSIQKGLKEYLLGVYLHGSLSTLDYVKGWSDLDALIIIKREVITDPYKLLTLRKQLLKITSNFFLIDPLQHHGFFVIAEQEMEYYPQHFFPLELFKFSTSLSSNNGESVFYERDSFIERINVFFRFCDYLKKYKLNHRLPKNAYEYKCLYHSLLLLPTLYIEAKGKYCYKKFSFKMVQDEFRQGDWEIIDIVSQIRSDWRYNQILSRNLAKGLSIFNPFFNHLVHKYFKRALPLTIRNAYLEEAIIGGIYKLSMAMSNKLEKYLFYG